MILLTAGTSLKRKKKNTRESNMTGIYERQRQKDTRGTKDERGRKKSENKSVKESQDGFSTCEKKKERPCYKFPRPALDLI